jgi:hypothetical protein
MIMAMSWRHQPSPACHAQLKRRNAARRVIARYEEMDPEFSEPDDLLGRIGSVLGGLMRHVHFSLKKVALTLFLATRIPSHIAERRRAFFVRRRICAAVLHKRSGLNDTAESLAMRKFQA